jgi:hypothetical protein
MDIIEMLFPITTSNFNRQVTIDKLRCQVYACQSETKYLLRILHTMRDNPQLDLHKYVTDVLGDDDVFIYHHKEPIL